MSTRSRLSGLLCALLVIPVSGWSQQISSTPNEVLTLDQAIALALRQNHAVRDEEMETAKTGDRVDVSRTLRLPSINLFALATDQFIKPQETIPANTVTNNIFPGVGPFFSIGVPRRPTAVVAGLILQPLSQQYRFSLTIKQARLAQGAEKERLRLVKQSTIDRVKQTYYGILETESSLESVEETITSYRELDRLTSDQVAQEVKLRSAGLDVKTRLAKAEYEALNLSNELATKKETLNKLLGRNVRTDFRLNPVPDVNGFPVDLESARTRALEQRPEVREAKL